jgi:uncharacterized protein (TIGR03089 family)
MNTVPAALAALLAQDPSRPLITWVDLDSGTRVELSRATAANWVAKTGGLLQDDLEVSAGDRVALALPVHWQAVTWALGCWAVGAVVQPVETAGPPDLEVYGDDRGPRTDARGAVVGLAPFGGPARPGSVVGGAVDAGALVLGHPDDLFVHDPPTATSPALAGPDGVLDHAAVLATSAGLANRIGLAPEGRLLTATPQTTADGLLETTLVPLVAGGSVVLVAGPVAGAVDTEAVARLAAEEQADLVRVTA